MTYDNIAATDDPADVRLPRLLRSPSLVHLACNHPTAAPQLVAVIAYDVPMSMLPSIRKRPVRFALRLALGLLLFAAVWLTATRLTAPGRAVHAYTLDAPAIAVASATHDAAPTDAAATAPRPALRIVTFNIAHGRGLAYDNYNGEPPEVRDQRLADIGELLRSLDADVVVLNEVDFDSSWSGRVDQARAIARAAGFSHVVEQTSFDTGLPLWRLRFGNAVLSRHPITDAARLELPAKATWESLVAGHKRALVCTIHPPPAPGSAPGIIPAFRLVAVHLEHRDESTRIESARRINELVESSDLPVIVAGDLNSSPPHYPHASVVDGATALSTLLAPGRLIASIPVNPTAADFTFRADAATELIDWVLTPPTWPITTSRAVPTTLSDHRPVVTDIAPPIPGK